MNNHNLAAGDIVYLRGNKLTPLVISEVVKLPVHGGFVADHAKCYWLDNNSVLQSQDIPVNVLVLKAF